jgi:hypothetical protein
MTTVTMEIDLPASSTPVVQLYSVSSRVTGASYGSPVTGTAVSGVSTRYVFALGTVAAGDYFGKITSPAGGFVLRVTDSGWDEAETWTELELMTSVNAGGVVTVSSPVNINGEISGPIVIGDDYKSANGRAFSWTADAPTGFVLATSTCKLGFEIDGVSVVKTGTITDAGSGDWTFTFDLLKTDTASVSPGWADWSVECISAGGIEHTIVKSGVAGDVTVNRAEFVEKQT